jgi:hypothetical protein
MGSSVATISPSRTLTDVMKVANIPSFDIPKDICHQIQKDNAIALYKWMITRHRLLSISPTQSGKTEQQITLAFIYLREYPNNNVIFSTNMSDLSNKNQTDTRIKAIIQALCEVNNLNPKSFIKNIRCYNNGDFQRHLKNKTIVVKNNTLILSDESDYGQLDTQILFKWFKLQRVHPFMEGTLDKRHRNIHIVSFSATPCSEMAITPDWIHDAGVFQNGKNLVVRMSDVDPDYYGSIHMMENGQLKQAPKDNKERFNIIIQEFKKSTKPVYGIIRINGTQNDNFQSEYLDQLDKKRITTIFLDDAALRENDYVEYILRKVPSINKALEEFIGESDDYNCRDISIEEKGMILRENQSLFMKYQPKRHTLLVIKGFMRRAITISKEHIAFTIDTPKSPVDTTAQSLVGRLGSYTKHNITCYCDLEAIKEYNQFFSNPHQYIVSKASGIMTKKPPALKVDHYETVPEHVSALIPIASKKSNTTHNSPKTQVAKHLLDLINKGIWNPQNKMVAELLPQLDKVSYRGTNSEDFMNTIHRDIDDGKTPSVRAFHIETIKASELPLGETYLFIVKADWHRVGMPWTDTHAGRITLMLISRNENEGKIVKRKGTAWDTGNMV